jgi:thiamine biosynthesis lipoprotein
MRAWGMAGGEGRIPDDAEIEAAKAITGMELVEIDGGAVRFLREGVMIDLGAIGKGYAIEQIAGLLREYEIPGALIHGGTSTVQAIGAQPNGAPWPIAIQHPEQPDHHVGVVDLQDNALSVSGSHGKSFTVDGKTYGHVLDPRTGYPTNAALLAAVVTESATDSDALSTALLAAGKSLVPIIESTFQAKTILLEAMSER